MKKLAVVLAGILLAAAVPVASMAADVNVNVQVGQAEPAPEPAPMAEEAPPPLEAQNPEMVVVPSGNADVYMVPNTYGVYFYNGNWFRYYNGVWFRSGVYNSGWVAVRPAIVPGVVIGIAPEYAMVLPVGYFRIGWGDFHSHWRGWGHSHHWNRYSWYQHERRADVRRDRMHHVDQRRHDWSRGQGHAPHGYHHGPANHKPAPHGNVHKPAPHGNINKPAPHGNINKPAPHGNINKPAPHGNINKPAPHGNINKPAPHGNINKPAPHGNINKPAPHGNINKPAPHGNINKPAPHGNINKPAPHGNINKPAPHGNINKPAPHLNKTVNKPAPHKDTHNNQVR